MMEMPGNCRAGFFGRLPMMQATSAVSADGYCGNELEGQPLRDRRCKFLPQRGLLERVIGIEPTTFSLGS